MSNGNNNGIQFSSLFTSAEVICQTDSTDRDVILIEMLRLLAYEKGIGNVDHAYHDLLERENEIPSIIAPGIAIPHIRIEALKDIVVCIATSTQGIIYPNKKDKPIKLFILILVPKDSPGSYLQALSSLAKICQDETTPEVVSEISTPEDIWKFFDRGGMVLPDHVRACDIMDPVKIKLQENDTLKRAIDLFVHYELTDLPVVDNDEELIGVVTTYQLLQVCLPDYILWMDDLSPILNFEPFAEILRKESSTWLVEIMTDEYATVAENAPAIQIAKEITRHHTDHAYVIRDRKLIGVVSLSSFLNKILRE
ncbi:MAG TPA: CBS domain-containing protein [Phycisphaerales bacterium]|nr:CBS domain-containing protein [Phycisphaerales bacterium]